MNTKEPFKKILISVFVILGVSIILLAFLSDHSNTKVVNIKLIGDRENASIKNQRVDIKFSKPISKEDSRLEVLIKAENSDQKITTKQFILGTRVIIDLDENLDYSTKYLVEITGLKDVYKKDVQSYSFDFQTIAPGFYYLENGDQKDRIMLYTLESREKIQIFEAEDIELYAFNSDYMAIVIEKAQYSTLSVVRLKDKKLVEELKFDFKQVGKLDITQRSNKIVYTLQEYEYQDEFVVPTTGFEVFYLDIQKGDPTKLQYGELDFDVNELVLSPDDNFILVEDSTEGYYLIDLNDTRAGIPLGRFVSTGGFNSQADKIIFLSFEPENLERDIFITYFDIKEGLKNITTGDYEVIDPRFFNTSDELVYSRFKDSLDSRGIYRIVRSTLAGEEKALLDLEGYSLEYPLTSYDDQYLVAEKYPYDSLVDFNYSRSTGYLTKPNSAELIVLDLTTNKLIVEGITGIDARWIW